MNSGVSVQACPPCTHARGCSWGGCRGRRVPHTATDVLCTQCTQLVQFRAPSARSGAFAAHVRAGRGEKGQHALIECNSVPPLKLCTRRRAPCLLRSWAELGRLQGRARSSQQQGGQQQPGGLWVGG